MRIFPAFLISVAPLAAQGGTATFNQQIAPVIFRNCSPCHRPGEAAPFALLSYEDAKKKGKQIGKVTSAHVMPPWKAEPASYAYRDERRLKEDEIALIQAWVKDGMPEGNGKKPEPPKFASGWRLGEPDLVIEMPAAYHVPADGPDIYRNIAVLSDLRKTSGSPRSTCVLPRVPSCITSSILPIRKDAFTRSNKAPSRFQRNADRCATIPLGGWALGAQPQFFPEGLALQLPKGSDLVFQYHFHPTGKLEAEKSLIGLYFAKNPPTRTMIRIQMPPHYSLFSELDIPPGKRIS